MAISATGLAGALLALFLTFGGWPPATDAGVPREIGRALAQEALKLLGPGKRLTVIARDTTDFKQPATDFALAAFQEEVRKAGATVSAVQRLQVDPLRPLEVPAGDFFELLRQGAGGDVVVSLMGPPLLSREQSVSVAGGRARVVAFCPGNLPAYLDLRLLAEQGLLHAAVLSRPLSSKGGAAPTGETFDALYQRLSQAELTRLPAR